MKKILMTILVTSLLMIGCIGGFLWVMNSKSQKLSKEEAALLKEEADTDMKKKAFEDIPELELQTLTMDGGKKNVITKDYNGVGDIYDPQRSAATKEMLEDIKKKGEYTTLDPLWAYNPYGTNPESFYLYFKSQGRCYCRYTVSVDDSKIPDFTRTLDNGASGNISTAHEYQILGLVPGKTNYIILHLYNKKDELATTLYYKVDMPESYSGADTFLDVETGYSKVALTNGLYALMQDAPDKKVTVTKTVTKKVKKGKRTVRKRVEKKQTKTVRKPAILLYDNSGVLRGELPADIRGSQMDMVYDNLTYACDEDSIAMVNRMGQVVERLDMPSYRQYGEFVYDDVSSIYVLAAPKKKNNSLGYVIKLEINSKKVSKAMDLSEIDTLNALMKRAKHKLSKKGDNRLGIDSVQVMGTNKLLLGSAEYSMIFQVSNAGSLMPKLDYVIADEKLWDLSGKDKATKRLKKKFLDKALAEGEEPPAEETPIIDSILDKKKPEAPELFASQYGQTAMTVEHAGGSLAEGQYDLYMLNNNTKDGKSAGKSSYYYEFHVDETAGNYILAKKDSLPKNTRNGNVIPLDKSYLYCISDKNTFGEYDTRGKLVRSYTGGQRIYRVFKNDWKGFWFY